MKVSLVVLLLVCVRFIVIYQLPLQSYTKYALVIQDTTAKDVWQPPDLSLLDSAPNGKMIAYGRDIIIHTARYFGTQGSIRHSTNGMNCQNCHLDAGTRLWGNNFSAVYSTYPKFRERSGTVETTIKRVNDCFIRSLNGQPLDTNCYEMQAIISYITWLGQNVKKGERPIGAGIEEIEYLNRAASPQKGKLLYKEKCTSCHQKNGEGVKMQDAKDGFLYAPLWGKNSYNTGAGLYRISRLAGFIKNNMPFGATRDYPILTNEEAWDLAAFINSNSRPMMDISADFKNMYGKPVDYPFSPFADTFSIKQHKYGPFFPIIKTTKSALSFPSKR